MSPQLSRYTWVSKGEPQSGELTLSREAEALSASWTDTWHSPQPMTLQHTDGGALISLLGSHSERWRWRIESGLEGEQRMMRMYKMTPRGKERIAVEFIADGQE